MFSCLLFMCLLYFLQNEFNEKKTTSVGNLLIQFMTVLLMISFTSWCESCFTPSSWQFLINIIIKGQISFWDGSMVTRHFFTVTKALMACNVDLWQEKLFSVMLNAKKTYEVGSIAVLKRTCIALIIIRTKRQLFFPPFFMQVFVLSQLHSFIWHHWGRTLLIRHFFFVLSIYF